MNDPLAILGIATTPLELLSFILAVITVVLTIRQNHWAWLFSIVSSATYGVVFYDAKLYGDMSLQVVFIWVSVWGWYQWLHGSASHDALVVSRSSRRGWIVSLLAWAAAFAALALFLDHYTDTKVPYMDGFLTAGSLVGQVLLARKKLENWLVWIVVDLIYVSLYMVTNLHLTAILYAIYVVLAVIGLREWMRAERKSA